MKQHQCYKCYYVWNIRTEKPKECPKCKVRLDYVFKEVVKHKDDKVVIKDKKDINADQKKYIPKEDN